MAMTSYEWRNLPEETRRLIQNNQQDVPVKASGLAKVLGVSVVASTLPAGISGEIRPVPGRNGEFFIKVNRHDSPRRQRFTVAHELGHFLLHRDQIRDGIRDDVLYRSNLSDRREAEANRIAADLLMPEPLMREWIEQARILQVEDTVAYLAERFDVSESAMKIRLGLG